MPVLAAMNTTALKHTIKLILQPNSERADENKPGFVGPGSPDLGLADYTSGCYLSKDQWGPYLEFRFYLPKEFQSSGRAKQTKVLAFQNENFRPKSDDYHYYQAHRPGTSYEQK